MLNKEEISFICFLFSILFLLLNKKGHIHGETLQKCDPSKHM